MSISFINVYKSFKAATGIVRAVNDLSIEIPTGTFLCVLGASGAGKSTILRLIAGLDQVDSGTILINGQKIKKNAEVGMVFQTPALMEYATVYQNIALALWSKKLPSDEVEKRVKSAAAKAQIDSLLARTVQNLSGGEKQRVAIARAAALKPSVFLFDEPLNSLDPLLRAKLRMQIKQLHADTGATFVYVTHDIFEARYFSQAIALIKDGCLLRLGQTESFFTNPKSDYEREFFFINN